jgi:bisphosphoglycerate-dependent phosphoglycerate mutase
MWNDEVVDDVRRARQANAAAHGNDLRRIFRDLKKKQDESGRTVVTLAPVPPPVIKRAAGAKPRP